MKDMVKKAGLENEIIVDSKACRTDEIGSDTHYGTKNKLREEEIPFTPRQARQITLADYDKYDYIIGMDEENMRDLARLTMIGQFLRKFHTKKATFPSKIKRESRFFSY